MLAAVSSRSGDGIPAMSCHQCKAIIAKFPISDDALMCLIIICTCDIPCSMYNDFKPSLRYCSDPNFTACDVCLLNSSFKIVAIIAGDCSLSSFSFV